MTANPLAQSKQTQSHSFVPEVEKNLRNSTDVDGVLDLHVVLLTNYIRKHHVVSYRELAKRVRKLTILLSTPMEPDRSWDVEWSDLNVLVQKNWMFTTKWRHPTGFKEDNYIHVPIDTVSQLKALKPDIVFSYEMGVRTALSGWFRRFNQKVPLVIVGNMSQHIEQERGFLRRTFRSLVRRVADCFTYNGPSCKRYLTSLGIADEKMFHVPYCIDRESVFAGNRKLADTDRPRRLLYCGSISERKGLLPFTQSLNRWCNDNPGERVDFQLAGDGPLKDALKEFECNNLSLSFLGNLHPAALVSVNQHADIAVLPSLADEWALVTIEALASGIPVLGSVYAQSVETEVKDNVNGWTFRPDDISSMDNAIGRALAVDAKQLHAMADDCRKSVAHISAERTAESFCTVIRSVLPKVGFFDR